MEQCISFEPAPRRKIRFERRDWLALLGVTACAAGYAFLHPGLFGSGNLLLPGVGMTLSAWAMLAICMGFIGWKKLQWNRQSIFLLAASLLLSASYSLFSNNALRYMNLPVLLTLCVLSVYALSGGLHGLSFRALLDAVFHGLRSIVHNLPVPALALGSELKSGNRTRLKEVLLGLCICVPVVGLILKLLCDADSIFGGMVSGMFSTLHSPNAGTIIFSLLRFVVLTLLLFGFVYGIKRSDVKREKQAASRPLPVLTAGTLLAAMSIVYAVFVYVQCRYLFAGADAVAAAGGYAVYARTGFFQLVAVGCITLCIVTPVLILQPESRGLHALCSFVGLMSLIIVFSAFRRMQLYIREYGLTLLRTVTLWGILAISAAMIGILFKAARPGLRVFRILFVFTICSWIAFNFCNINQRIVDYNLNAYRSGAMETIDYRYLGRLGPEALPALEYLQQENRLPCEEMGEVKEIAGRIHASKPEPYDWSFAWLKL